MESPIVTASSSSAEPGQPLPTVLVVDDERGPRESLRILLKNDYTVYCADSVNAALRLLRAHTPDVVVMDIRMPGKTGIEGLREMREVDSCVSIIMLTGYGALETAQEAIRLGANDYLKKPFDALEMQLAIQRNVKRTQLERRRQQAVAELAELNRKLLEEITQSDHFALIGRRSAEFAHDLRNPLTLVMGYVDLLSEQLNAVGTKLGEQWTETSSYLEMIESSVARCKEMADSWLSLSREGLPTPAPVEVCGLVTDLVTDIRPWAHIRGAEIFLRMDPPPLMVSGMRLQLLRAIQNILVNAMEAVQDREGRIEVGCVRDDSLVVISVKDNGCGMSSEQMSRAFEAYRTTKANGTGLGLTITRQIVTEHGGIIEIASEKERGTTVTLRLPLMQQAGT